MVHSKRLRNFNMHHLDTKATVEEFLMLVRSWGDDSLLGLTHRAMIVFLVDLFGESLLKFKFQLIWRMPVITARKITRGIKHTH
ncbi:hypothetical protein HanIR_Chr14g0723351 [Helianthus annuus]|nr:hypothetical protein HanIR_Chr14g0723351 [Helianthus annuus]